MMNGWGQAARLGDRGTAASWTRRVAPTTLILLGSAGCSLLLEYEDAGPTVQSEVRLVHGALDLGPVRLEVAGAPPSTALRFPEATPYVVQRVSVQGQTPTPIEVVLRDLDTGGSLAEDDLASAETLAIDPFGPGRQLITIHLWQNRMGEVRALALRDDPTPSDAPDHMRLRLVNLVPDQGEIFAFRPPALPLIGQPPGRAGPYGDFPLDARDWGFDFQATDPRAVEVVGRTVPWSPDDVSDAILMPTAPSPDVEPAQLCVLGVDDDRRCYPLVPGSLEDPA